MIERAHNASDSFPGGKPRKDVHRGRGESVRLCAAASSVSRIRCEAKIFIFPSLRKPVLAACIQNTFASLKLDRLLKEAHIFANLVQCIPDTTSAHYYTLSSQAPMLTRVCVFIVGNRPYASSLSRGP